MREFLDSGLRRNDVKRIDQTFHYSAHCFPRVDPQLLQNGQKRARCMEQNKPVRLRAQPIEIVKGCGNKEMS